VEYRPGFARCSDCDVDLVQELPEAHTTSRKPKRDWVSIARTQIQTRELKTKLTVYLSLFLCALGIVGSSLWWKRQEAARRELYLTYGYACMGDAPSLNKLAQGKSAETTLLLRRIAFGNSCSYDMRVEAIRTLAERKLLRGEELSALLQIDQPFLVRHAVLDSLHALFDGQLTQEAKSEMEFQNRTKELNYQPSAQDLGVIREQLRQSQQQTQWDYFRLLSKTPCRTQEILRNQYAAGTPFADFVRKNVPAC
jgi:hypothetical protein